MRPLLACLMIVAAGACAGARGFVWLDEVHDFGAFSEEIGLAECTFRAVNADSVPLAVISARANCGCTRPRYPLHTIAPGDTLELKVAYDAKGRPGRFEKKVYVSTSDGIETTLRVRGTVIGLPSSLSGRYPVVAGPARYSAAVLPFGEVLKGHAAHAQLRGYNSSGHTITPRAAKVPKYIDIRIWPDSVPAGEQFLVSATVASDRCEGWGFVTDSLEIVAGGVPLAVSTVTNVREDFSRLTPGQLANAPEASVEPAAVDFGSFSTADAPMKRTFRITNTGKSPLLVRQISTPDGALRVKCGAKKIGKGKSAEAEVTLLPEATAGSEILNARITVITNDPSRPVRMVRAVGEIKP